MAGKKKTRDFTVVEVEPIDVESVEIKDTSPKSTFQSYNWWIDNVTNETWAYSKEAFTDAEITKIIQIGQAEATAAGNDVDVLDGSQTRSWIRSDVESNRWIFQKLAGTVQNINNQFFNYDINYIDTLQFIRVDEDSKVDGKYVDLEYNSTGTKKLSFVVQLSAANDYEGGTVELYTGADATALPKAKGSVNVFPAFVLRDVTKVTEGANYLLVGTVVGPRFK